MKKSLQMAAIGGLLCVAVVGIAALPSKKSEAAVGFPFGGRIETITPCNNGFLIKLSAPTPILIMYPFEAKFYSYGPPRNPGQWLLGSAVPGGVCNIGIFTHIPTVGTVLFLGSSLVI